MANKKEILEELITLEKTFDEISEMGDAFAFLKDEEPTVDDKALNKVSSIAMKAWNSIRSFKFLVAASDVKDFVHPKGIPYNADCFISGASCGDLVSVRPCDDEYEGKTFLGIFIGEIALGTMGTIKENEITCSFCHTNPAIFVPAIKKVIFGCGSWWGKINSEEDFKQITDDTIDNTWYVQMLKGLDNGRTTTADDSK